MAFQSKTRKKGCDTLKISFAYHTWFSVLIYTQRILPSVIAVHHLMKYHLNEINQLEERNDSGH